MVHKLVLNVRIDSRGRLVLYQMWTQFDCCFALFGGERDVFRKVAP
jgi:hypothetical protein